MAKDDNEKRKHYVRAAYAPDGPGAAQMLEILETHGIDAFRHGGIKDIYKIGGDVVGEEIMVDPEDLPRAKELLGEMSGEDQSEPKPKPSMKTTFLSLLAAVILLIILLIIRGRFFV